MEVSKEHREGNDCMPGDHGKSGDRLGWFYARNNQGQPVDIGLGRSFHQIARHIGYPRCHSSSSLCSRQKSITLYRSTKTNPYRSRRSISVTADDGTLSALGCGKEENYNISHASKQHGWEGQHGTWRFSPGYVVKKRQVEWEILVPQILRAYRGTFHWRDDKHANAWSRTSSRKIKLLTWLRSQYGKKLKQADEALRQKQLEIWQDDQEEPLLFFKRHGMTAKHKKKTRGHR